MTGISDRLGALALEVVRPPGGYGDGPAYLRVHRGENPTWWHGTGLRRLDLPPFGSDPDHDYIRADNSHSAFAYRRWLLACGIDVAVLTVLRRSG